MGPVARSCRMTAIAAASVLLAVSVLYTGNAGAWNHSELHWRTIATEHFEIHFHEGVEWSAREVAAIAEEIYGPITSMYGYETDKVHINITDRADLPEGAAYYYLNRIDINIDDVDFHLRGTPDWLRYVITHEFTHMVSLQASMKMPRWMPAVYLQGFNFEKEKRPDVITGYPNFVGSLPMSGDAVPNWFAEGVAQHQADGARYDIWDSHRDMVLRMAALDGRLLTLDEMGVFGKGSQDAELLYNQGYSLVRHISSRYGEDRIRSLTEGQGNMWRAGFGGACREVLGISEDELYRDWEDSISAVYASMVSGLSPGMDGIRVAGNGFLNLSPIPDLSGGYYYISNMGSDFRDLDLVHLDAAGKTTVLAEDVSSGTGMNGRLLAYSKETRDNEHDYLLEDVYILDSGTGEERRVTVSLKATQPEFSPDGERVAFVIHGDGFSSIGITDVPGGGLRRLTGEKRGRKYCGISWSRKGILASRFDGTSGDIVLISPESGEETVLVGTDADERDPCWSDTGDGFFYSSDRTGIFNVYYRDLDGGYDLLVTDVEGGAFHACPNGADIIFASYGRKGYEIRRIPEWRESASRNLGEPDYRLIEERVSAFGASEGAGGDAHGEMTSSAYNITYSPPFLFPRLMVYDEKFRVGFAVDSRDYLDRQGVYAAASASFDGEFDLQLGAELRQFKPTFLFDILRMRKYWEIDDPEAGMIKYRYDLWDAYFTCRLEFEQETPRSRKDISIRYNHGEYGVNINAWEQVDIELGWNYYKADEITVMLDYRNIRNTLEWNINPRGGRTFHLEGAAVMGKLSSGDFEYSFQPLYNDNNFGRYTIQYEEYLPLPFWAHTMELFLRGGWIDREDIDDFFYLYLGSRDGLRGYSYYSIGGTKNAMARLTYCFPLWRNIDRQVTGLYFRSLYAAVFAETGKAWNSKKFDIEDLKSSVGYEIRMSGFTFFSYPLAMAFIGAYGLDLIEYGDPFAQDLAYTEGESWRYYGSVLFSF